jgi:hypothetical protein
MKNKQEEWHPATKPLKTHVLYRVLWQKCPLKNNFEADVTSDRRCYSVPVFVIKSTSQMTTPTYLVKNHIYKLLLMSFLDFSICSSPVL